MLQQMEGKQSKPKIPSPCRNELMSMLITALSKVTMRRLLNSPFIINVLDGLTDYLICETNTMY